MKGKGHDVTARNIALGDAHSEARPLTTDPWDNAILTEDDDEGDRVGKYRDNAELEESAER